MRRRLLPGVLAALIAFVLAGCGRAVVRQEVVVHFVPGATQADHLRVWQSCPGGPGVIREPLATDSRYPSTLLNNVRYRVETANNYQLQQLYDCLRKDPSVAGYALVGGDQQ